MNLSAPRCSKKRASDARSPEPPQAITHPHFERAEIGMRFQKPDGIFQVHYPCGGCFAELHEELRMPALGSRSRITVTLAVRQVGDMCEKS